MGGWIAIGYGSGMDGDDLLSQYQTQTESHFVTTVLTPKESMKQVLGFVFGNSGARIAYKNPELGRVGAIDFNFAFSIVRISNAVGE